MHSLNPLGNLIRCLLKAAYLENRTVELDAGTEGSWDQGSRVEHLTTLRLAYFKSLN